MSVSVEAEIREFYDESAETYAEIIDSEIELPVYRDLLGQLAERIAGQPGALVDTSCGPGHILLRYHQQFEPTRRLIGIDLSPRMVALASTKLGSAADVRCCDMRDVPHVEAESGAAVISLFALHHVNAEDAIRAMREWHRILATSGQLLVGTWEGTGLIDYGDSADIAALRYTADQVRGFVSQAGFVVDRCVVEPVEGMPMNAVYLEGTKQ